jgi:hypothetical protein
MGRITQAFFGMTQELATRHVGTLRGVATKSIGPNLYGGSAEVTRARALVLVGVMSVLGLIMAVTWTVVRNEAASSDSDRPRAAPYVADPVDDGLRPAGVLMFSPTHAALPALARSSPPEGATPAIAASAVAASSAQATAPATPSAPSTTVAPPAPAVTSSPTPSTGAAAPPTSPQPAASSAAAAVPAAVETPAPPAPSTPAVVAPASEPAGPDTGGRGDGGPARTDPDRGEEKPHDDKRDEKDAAKEAKEQLKAQEAAEKQSAKANDKMDDAPKGKGGKG